MRRLFAFPLAFLFATPAAAQCLSVPDGAGGVAVHCQDGRTGFLATDPGGAVAGMLGGQPLAPPPELLTPRGLRSPATTIEADPARAAPPPLASETPPPPTTPEPPRFSTYTDPEAAGLRTQPGEK